MEESVKDVLVSIIIPVYNIENYLPICIESIVTQSYNNLQVIIVDDGSIDNTAEIARLYAEKDDRIVLIQQRNSGVSSARNHGLKKAEGEYVMFVDGDDWIDRNTVEDMLSVVRKYNLDVVRCGFVFEDINSNNRRVSCNKKPLSLIHGEEILRVFLRGYGVYASVCGGLYKRSFIDKYNFSFETGVVIGEDGYFTLKVMSQANSLGIMGGLKSAYYHVLVRNNSATRSDIMKRASSAPAPSYEDYLRQMHLWDKFETDCNVWTVRATSSELCKAASRLSFRQYSDFYKRRISEKDFKKINRFTIRKLMTPRNHIMSFLCKSPTLSYIAILSIKKVFGKILF